MRMRIDSENCTGHGRCAHYAPDIFRLDENGYNIDAGRVIDIPPGQEKVAIMGMKSCPERAITIVQESEQGEVLHVRRSGEEGSGEFLEPGE